MRAGLLLTRHLTSRNRRLRDTAHFINELELYAAVFHLRRQRLHLRLYIIIITI